MYDIYNKIYNLITSAKERKPNKLEIKRTVGFIGSGNLAQALATGVLEAGTINAGSISVSRPSETNLPFWKSRGISSSNSYAEVVRKSEIVIIAIKPRDFDEALNMFGPVYNNRLYLSTLAGIPIEKINGKLRNHYKCGGVGSDPWRVIRAVPNTPFMVGAGATVFAVGGTASPDDIFIVKTMFSSGGICEMVPEHLLDAATALSGGGPAYVYVIIEALSDGAVKMGLSRALATRLACQTLLGGAIMVQRTGKHPGHLKSDVCSPGGATITGVHVLEQSGVRAAFMEAIETATTRAIELGKQ